ncbi:hypothetical protein [Actinophytocola sediminis]
MRRGRVTTGVLLWLVAAAAATAVGMTAVSAIGTDIFGGGSSPLSQSEVDDQLRSRPAEPAESSRVSPPTSPTTSPPTSVPVNGQEVTTTTAGGTVLSQCAPGGVRVLQAVPEQGFLVDSDDEVDDHPSVKFQSGDREIEVRLRCVNGAPKAEIDEDD